MTQLRLNSEADKLFSSLNSYYENIKLTTEINPNKFLVPKIIRTEDVIKIQNFRILTKMNMFQ